MDDENERVTKHINRNKVKSSKKCKYWCDCDRVKTSPGAKCPICHRRDLPKRFKKG